MKQPLPPSHKAHRRFWRPIGAILIVLAVFLIFMAIHEQHKHTQLNASIDALQANLTNSGVTTQKTTGCGRPYVEFGRGQKQCSVYISSNVIGTENLDKVIASYVSVLHRSNFISKANDLSPPFNDSDERYGSAVYNLKSSPSACLAFYDAVGNSTLSFSKTQKYSVQFSCDDTSWFVKVFEP